MSALANREGPANNGRNKEGAIQLGGLPQVNLLPNDIRLARNLQRTKIYLLVVTFLVILGIVGVYMLSSLDAERAMEHFTAEQSRAAPPNCKLNSASTPKCPKFWPNSTQPQPHSM